MPKKHLTQTPTSQPTTANAEQDDSGVIGRLQERPRYVTREYVVPMLAQVLHGTLPDDLVSPLLDYLVDKDVILRRWDIISTYSLPKGHGDLAAYPNDAIDALSRAIAAHAGSDNCPELLREALWPENPAQVSEVRRLPDLSRINRVLWDREIHVEALSGFGHEHSERAYEVLTFLVAGLAAPPLPPAEPDDRSDQQRALDARNFSIESIRIREAARARRAEDHRRNLLAAVEQALSLAQQSGSPTTEVGPRDEGDAPTDSVGTPSNIEPVEDAGQPPTHHVPPVPDEALEGSLATPKRKSSRPQRAATKPLSDMAILVLRALPSCREDALRTLDEVADGIATNPKPSTSSVCRAISELRQHKPPLADAASYRRTQAGDAESAR